MSWKYIRRVFVNLAKWNPDLLSVLYGNMYILGSYYLFPSTGGLVELVQYVSYFTFN